MPSAHRKFCSPKCAYASKERVSHVHPKERGSATCEHCGLRFKIRADSGKARFCSKACARTAIGRSTIIANRRFAPNSFKYGWHDVGGQTCFFRSSWEYDFAKHLQCLLEDGKIMEWRYEPDVFDLGHTTYTPDFRVTSTCTTDSYVEVKGWMNDRSAEKLLLFWMLYPTVKLALITELPKP